MNRIHSKIHNIGLCIINKVYFPSYDDKKYILKEVYSKLCHFHKSTR